MLHQFLSAETVQVSKEGLLFSFLGVLFLSHICTVIEASSCVNYTGISDPMTKAWKV